MKKVYITKYALTTGIEEIDAEQTNNPEMIVVKRELGTEYFHNGDWFEDKSMAIADAEKRRTKKVESIKKQLKKLESLKF